MDVDSSDIAQLWRTAEIVLPSCSVFRKMTSVRLQPETGIDSPPVGWTAELGWSEQLEVMTS